jgi:hypothetical protein
MCGSFGIRTPAPLRTARLTICGVPGMAAKVELKRLGLKNLQATVLEVVNSDTQEIEQTEEAWKKKLMSRKFGLNRN